MCDRGDKHKLTLRKLLYTYRDIHTFVKNKNMHIQLLYLMNKLFLAQQSSQQCLCPAKSLWLTPDRCVWLELKVNTYTHSHLHRASHLLTPGDPERRNWRWWRGYKDNSPSVWTLVLSLEGVNLSLWNITHTQEQHSHSEYKQAGFLQGKTGNKYRYVL